MQIAHECSSGWISNALFYNSRNFESSRKRGKSGIEDTFLLSIFIRYAFKYHCILNTVIVILNESIYTREKMFTWYSQVNFILRKAPNSRELLFLESRRDDSVMLMSFC